MLLNTRLERLSSTKHSNLLGLLVSYNENEVLITDDYHSHSGATEKRESAQKILLLQLELKLLLLLPMKLLSFLYLGQML